MKKMMAVVQAVVTSIIKPSFRIRMVMNVFDVMSHVQPVERQQNVSLVKTDTGVAIANITATVVVKDVIKTMVVQMGAILVITKV